MLTPDESGFFLAFSCKYDCLKSNVHGGEFIPTDSQNCIKLKNQVRLPVFLAKSFFSWLDMVHLKPQMFTANLGNC